MLIRNEMNSHYRPILLISVIILALLSGCIKDDYKDCVQGLKVGFYTKTPCQIDASYPEQIKDIALFVFDKNDILVSYQQTNDVKLQKDYLETIETESGMYTVVAWSGLSSNYYDLINPKEKVTTKHDLLFRLKRTAEQISNIDGSKVYYGESPLVNVPQATSSESIFENTAVNMQEITNRLTITVEGLPNPLDYAIEIESNNGAMNIDGTIAKDETLKYSAETTEEAGVMKTAFTLLKLETGYTNTIVIKSKLDGTELYRGSLLGTLLLKNPDVNLACDHDFTIKFTTKDQCNCGTYTIMEIWVNNWLVHSYETDI